MHQKSIEACWGARISAHPGDVQFAFGFYSAMLAATILGLLTAALFKPRR